MTLLFKKGNYGFKARMITFSSLRQCVSCGQTLTVDYEAGEQYINHKCSASHESAKASANTRDYNINRERTFSQKLLDVAYMYKRAKHDE